MSFGYRLLCENLSEKQLRDLINNNNLDLHNWRNIFIYQDLSQEFINEFINKVLETDSIIWLFKKQNISEEFILNCLEKIEDQNLKTAYGKGKYLEALRTNSRLSKEVKNRLEALFTIRNL